MKRVAVFVFYDKNGLVDDYVTVLLKGIRPFCQEIICVINGDINDPEKKKLQQECDVVLQRNNIGLDVEAYKEGFFYIINHQIETDEILFLNATVFGPIYPFSEVFSEMDSNKDLDFWGMTQHNGFETNPWRLNGLDYVPKHIQTYFWAVRKRLFQSNDFLMWWEKLPKIQTYYDAVSFHEMLFTRHFDQLGYKWGTYIKPDWYDTFIPYPLIGDPIRLLKRQRCPVIKRKSFLINRSIGDIIPTQDDYPGELYSFLRDETDYDVSLIANNITRTECSSDYLLTLGLLLPKRAGDKVDDKVCVIYYINSIASAVRLSEIALPKGRMLLVFCAPDVQIQSVREILTKIDYIGNASSAVDALLKSVDRLGDTKYVGWLQSVPYILDTNPGMEPEENEDIPSFFQGAGLLGNIEYAIAFMQHDKNVGAIVPLPLTHGSKISQDPDWSDQRDIFEKAMMKFGLPLPETEPFSIASNAFVAQRNCFIRFCEMAKELTQPNHMAYLMPFASQSLGQLIAFGANKSALMNQAITEYLQLHNLTANIATSDVRREDQLVRAAESSLTFFHDFFTKRSFRKSLFFSLMAFLPQNMFSRFQKVLNGGRKQPYPYDVYRIRKEGMKKSCDNPESPSSI